MSRTLFYIIIVLSLPSHVKAYKGIAKINAGMAPELLINKRGVGPYVAPAILVSVGTVIHYMPDKKKQFRDYAQGHFAYHGNIDDYLQYAPGAALYTLHAFGIKGENNIGDLTAILLKSYVLNASVVIGLKNVFNEKSPGGGQCSFPSGHTSIAFTLACIVHNEYGEKSAWFGIGAYACAATVGAMRIAGDAHWASDVLAGAGIGMLSAELVYLTHQYKWGKGYIKNLDIFPFRSGKQKGITLVCSF